MRYWYLDIKIINGEYEFHSRSTQKTKAKEEFDAESYVANFYGFEEGKNEDSGYYEFNCGNIACKVNGLQEITKEEYRVLNKYLW